MASNPRWNYFTGRLRCQLAEYEKKVRKVLAANGFVFKRRGKGDHDIWHNALSNRTVSVDGVIKSRHMANKIMTQAGINHKF